MDLAAVSCYYYYVKRKKEENKYMKKIFKSKKDAFNYARHEAFEMLCFCEDYDSVVSVHGEIKIRYFKGRDEWEVEVPVSCRH